METIGILPCGGLGLRMRPLRYPKELLPVSYCSIGDAGAVKPKLSIEYSIEAFRLAGITKCYIIVPDWKPEIMRYLGDGAEFDINISYLHNSKANGLSDAVFSMEPWSNGILTALALPDTQFYPQNAFASLLQMMELKKADLTLGVFPTDEPQCLAPVELNPEGVVLNLEDKPNFPRFMNAWGIAIWNSNFWRFFKSVEGTIPIGSSISEVFQRAVIGGLRVYGKFFEKGRYYDIGKIDSLPFVLK
jgi:glucose-1-phosphate thymidylyltransferase